MKKQDGYFWTPITATAWLLIIMLAMAGIIESNSIDDHKPVMLQPAQSWTKAKLFAIEDRNGTHLITLDEHTMHVLYINPDWCQREFGHAWESDDLTIFHNPNYGNLLPINGQQQLQTDPCNNSNYERHFHCRICKLKKTEKSTCQAAAPVVKTDTMYERPVKP